MTLLQEQQPLLAATIGCWPTHEEPAGDELQEDSMYPAWHLMCAG